IAERTETSHGRNEWRQAEIVAAAEPLMPGHQAFIRITSRRDQARPLMRLFMASTLMSPQRALDLTRAHWQIENGLHWMLDVHLDEDLSRARKDNAPANTALLNRLARNILQAADVAKVPISHRIKKCAWNDDYLINAITHMR
ncbi:ISAs1 family transposase, partial [Mesorhizobium sp. M1295]|uniref:ISAs1 family transposase n=1 Tax=Mesorhizobium sp. M1295 TaxID=2957076 RepID=UPI003334DB82